MRVLVADKLSQAGVDALAEHVDVDVRTGLDKSELVEAIGVYDGVVVRSATRIDADVIAAASRLKVVGRAGIGLDNVDIQAATARGVLVCNAPQSNVISAAEHAVALLLASARNIPVADQQLRQGRWERSAFQGTELHGKALGVLGLGRVGTLVAQRCSAFGMRLYAYDPFVSTERAARLGVELLPDVRAVCEVADFVSVHLPKNAETVGLIGEEQLRAMGPSARLVNTARGGIVDEAALARAVREGWIAGAALDVFETEPTTSSELFELPAVVVTPHLGASTAEAQDKAGTMIAEAVVAALRGEFVASAVNLQVGAGVPATVKPYLSLVEKLGRLYTSLHEGFGAGLTVEYLGRIAEEETEALTLAAIKGVLTDVTSEPVTYVNAPLLAEERGLKISTLTSPAAEDYVSLVRLSSDDVRVTGTLVGPGDRERLVEVWGFPVDMEPSDHLLVLRYRDRPGMVGVIGNALGTAQVNIASMQVGRLEAGGDAIMLVAVDSPVPAVVVDHIAEQIGATRARALSLS